MARKQIYGLTIGSISVNGMALWNLSSLPFIFLNSLIDQITSIAPALNPIVTKD